jgi:hypothetical protein
LGCKNQDRMAVGCPFITCAIKKMGVEFCWDCKDNATCEKWQKHREAGKSYDSFKSYRRLEGDINFIREQGVEAFNALQLVRESLLRRLLDEFNEGRSKSYYCIAATVLEIEELKDAIEKADSRSKSYNIIEKSRLMHSLLDVMALEKGHKLSLRK